MADEMNRRQAPKRKQRSYDDEDGKEACLAVIDGLIERGVDVTSLGTELDTTEYERVRKRCIRNFGSVDLALTAYGVYPDIGTPSSVEIYRCFEIASNYEVVCNEYEVERIAWAYSIPLKDINSVLRGARAEMELDALDCFYREKFPFDGITWTTIRREYPHVLSYIRSHFDGFIDYVNSYGWDYTVFVDRRFGGRVAIRSGHIFERKLGEVLKCLYTRVEIHPRRGDCLPDFIVNGEWVDAKLSEWTVYDKRSSTIRKYLGKTDTLTIYYARRTNSRQIFPVVNGLAVKHVSSLYPELERIGRCDLIADMKAFVNRVSVTKADVSRRKPTARTRKQPVDHIAE